MTRFIHKLLTAGALLLGLSALSSPAVAGNIWLTGHDADLHCAFGSQCNHFGAAVDFARQDAPNPTLPVLALTNNVAGDFVPAFANAASQARNTVEGAGNPFNVTILDPTTVAFAATSLDVASFSAIVIASYVDCGGCDLLDSGIDAIAARSAEITSFFNDGGGLVYFAGSGRATSTTAAGNGYYDTVPVNAAGAIVSPPFTISAIGAAAPFLLTDSDANCCATHNSFSPDIDPLLLILETDSAGIPETLAAGSVTIGEDGFEDGGGGGNGAAVPEPGTLTLLGLGLLGMGLTRRRRRRG